MGCGDATGRRDKRAAASKAINDYFTTALLIDSHRVAASKAEAALMALRAGLDVELPALDCYAELAGLVERGELAIEDLDRSVRRILRLKLRLGLFEAPYVEAEAASVSYQTPEARRLVEYVFKPDLDRYGYAFDEQDQRPFAPLNVVTSR